MGVKIDKLFYILKSCTPLVEILHRTLTLHFIVHVDTKWINDNFLLSTHFQTAFPVGLHAKSLQ